MDIVCDTTSRSESCSLDIATHEGGHDFDGVVVPEVGMSFGGELDVHNLYRRYAESKGFGIAKISVKIGEEGRPKYFSLACSHNGKHIPSSSNVFNPRPSIKTGYKAKINVVVSSEGDFVISKVYLDHNHALSPEKQLVGVHVLADAKSYCDGSM